MPNVLDIMNVETFQQKLNEQLDAVLKWPKQQAGGPSQFPIPTASQFLTKVERREFGEENPTYKYVRKMYIANLKEFNAGRTSSFVLLFTTYGVVQVLEYQRAIVLGKYSDVLEVDEEDDLDDPFEGEEDEDEEEEELATPAALAESLEPTEDDLEEEEFEDDEDGEYEEDALLPPIRPRPAAKKRTSGNKTKKKAGSKTKKKKKAAKSNV